MGKENAVWSLARFWIQQGQGKKSVAGSTVGGRGWHRTDRKYQEAGRFLVHSPDRILADDRAGHCTSPG